MIVPGDIVIMNYDISHLPCTKYNTGEFKYLSNVCDELLFVIRVQTMKHINVQNFLVMTSSGEFLIVSEGYIEVVK